MKIKIIKKGTQYQRIICFLLHPLKKETGFINGLYKYTVATLILI